MPKYTLYELIPSAEDDGRVPQFSSHVTKSKLELAYLGVPYSPKGLDFMQIRGFLADKCKDPEVTVPTLESDDGTVITDSWKIAEYLEDKYAKRAGKTLFGGSVESKALCKFVEQYVEINVWAEIAPLLGPMIWSSLSGKNAEYFVNDKYGISKDEMLSRREQLKDPEHVKKHAALVIRKLRTLEHLLQDHKDHGRPVWVTGVGPSHADFCVFGLYTFSRLSDQVHEIVWKNERLPRVQELIRGVLDLGLIEEKDLPKGVQVDGITPDVIKSS